LGVAAPLLLGAILALPAGSHFDPAAQLARAGRLTEVATRADAAWGELQVALETALEPARAGAALVVSGNAPPGAPLLAAADAAEAAAPAARAAMQAELELRGTLIAARPGQPSLSSEPLPRAAELLAIGQQLRASAEAAGPFVDRRQAAHAALVQLGAALAALDADDLTGATARLQAAADARDVVAAWEDPPSVLTVWLDTTGSLIDAAEQLVAATRRGDDEAADAAAAAYAAAAEGARQADVALAVAVSEAGASLTSTPLRRLADALAATVDARAGVAPLLQIDS
jgi:hypothetical protein